MVLWEWQLWAAFCNCLVAAVLVLTQQSALSVVPPGCSKGALHHPLVIIIDGFADVWTLCHRTSAGLQVLWAPLTPPA
jgi:hypothetical protein